MSGGGGLGPWPVLMSVILSGFGILPIIIKESKWKNPASYIELLACIKASIQLAWQSLCMILSLCELHSSLSV